VIFRRSVHVGRLADVQASINITADTRYKILVNGKRVVVGPTRSSSQIWYYDTLDLAPWLKHGSNLIEVQVLRFYPSKPGGVPFARTILPGLTICGLLKVDQQADVDLGTLSNEWVCEIVRGLILPLNSEDDYFLNVSYTIIRCTSTANS
jgi:hypothetical protein